MRIERVLWCLGATLLLAWGAATFGPGLAARVEAWRWVEQEHANDDVLDGGKGQRAVPGDPSFQATRSRERAGRRESLGSIDIPRLGLSATIAEGTHPLTLLYAAGHVESSVFPGEYGNCALAGHRDTLFRALSQVEPGDRIRVMTLDATCEYLVVSIEVVEPMDTEVLGPTAQPQLTLVTCYPFRAIGSAPQRCIVSARLVQPEAMAIALDDNSR